MFCGINLCELITRERLVFSKVLFGLTPVEKGNMMVSNITVQ